MKYIGGAVHMFDLLTTPNELEDELGTIHINVCAQGGL